jgi:hypothetical protein
MLKKSTAAHTVPLFFIMVMIKNSTAIVGIIYKFNWQLHYIPLIHCGMVHFTAFEGTLVIGQVMLTPLHSLLSRVQ